MIKTVLGSVYCTECDAFKGIQKLVIGQDGTLKLELDCNHKRRFKLQEIK